MELQEGIKLAKQLAKTQEKHQDYARVVKLADEYMTLITGEDMQRLLFQFIQREDKTMFDQRLRLTQAITPAIASSIMKPFYKVSRNDKVRKRFDFKSPDKNKDITTMLEGFYGSKRRKTKGLDYWLKTRFVELTFHDPNGWIVTEWKQVDLGELPEPHPFEVSAKEAVNFKFVNDDLKWLFVELNIKFDRVNQKNEIEKADGLKWTLYDEDYTIVICRVCKKKMKMDGQELTGNQQLIEMDDNDYLLTVYEPKLGFVPAFRVGYNRDGYTKGRTFVNPFHPAMPFFKKSIKTVSELDLTMTLHAFPQKLQYVEKCQGISKVVSCHGGYKNGTSDKCEACKGTGYKVHTTAQDAILMPMPEQGEEHPLKLDELLVYKTPPIELIKFQDEYTKGLKLEAHMAVYNSSVLVNPESQVAKTATEVDTNMQSIYDTLEPYTEKISEIYKEVVYTFAYLAAVENPEDGENIHQYPGDLKLKTTGVLLNELKLVNESGAPSFMRDAIGNDLAEIIYSGDDLGYTKYATKHRFFPFNGKNPEEIAMLMGSQHVSRFTKVLYSNFEAIFTDIGLETPSFWFMKSYSKQWNIVQEKVNEYMEELGESDPVFIDFGRETDPGIIDEDADDEENPGKGDGNAGDEDESVENG